MLRQSIVISCVVLLGACESIKPWESWKSVTTKPVSEKQSVDTTQTDAVHTSSNDFANTFVTLGTIGGPVAGSRGQPSNLLMTDSGNYLVDAGDGTASKLGKSGIPLRSIDSIFISHLHFDHIGGIPAIMGLRYQINANKQLTIYGPPGTKETVDGIFAYMAPEMRVGYAVPGAPKPPTPQQTTKVIEITPGKPFEVNGMTVKAVENTHFTLPKGSKAAELNKSYAYRFDLPDRSIVYTGDTGPSETIEELASGADLLVSEMMDVPFIISNLLRDNAKRERPAPAKAMEGVAQHLRDHHVTATQVGEMAKRAGVKKVVVTHFAGKGDPQSLEQYKADIAKEFSGEVSIASDLDKH